MINLTCIVCPIGCSLVVKDETAELSITGNRCQRGIVYAQEEIRSPKRTVTATALITENQIADRKLSVRRLPVKTSSACPKEKIPALLEDIYKLKVSLPVKVGDVLITGWNGEGIDIVATRSLS